MYDSGGDSLVLTGLAGVSGVQRACGDLQEARPSEMVVFVHLWRCNIAIMRLRFRAQRRTTEAVCTHALFINSLWSRAANALSTKVFSHMRRLFCCGVSSNGSFRKLPYASRLRS